MVNKIKVWHPQYIDDFKCVGGSCEDICCKDWRIYIDQDTFGKYISIKNDIERNYIIKNITIRENPKNHKLDYGVIKLNQEKKCPFLDEKNYCSIQKCFGEDYLSNVCASFPRVITKINDEYEISLNISCYEAAKVVLLNKEKMKFNYAFKELNKFEPVIEIHTNDDFYENTNGHYLIPIRKLSIDAVQDRRYSIYERLSMLGYLLEYISKKLTYNYNSFSMILDNYDFSNFHVRKSKDDMNYMMQIAFFKNITSIIKGWNDEITRKFEKIIDKAEKGFNFNDGRSIMEKRQIYIRAYEIVENRFNNKFNHIFENYFANLMFQSFFPFSENDDMTDDYISLIIRFSFISFLTVGNYLYDAEVLDEDLIVNIMQVLTKDLDHNERRSKELHKYYRKNGFFNMKFARTLL